MKGPKFRLLELSDDINNLVSLVDYLEEENARLRDYETKYNKLVVESIHHSETMMGQFLKATLDGRISIPGGSENRER